MDLQFFGANCVVVSIGKLRVVIDDNLADLGAKPVLKAEDIVLFTGPHAEPATETKLIVDRPGEYEISDVSIHGIAARGHLDEKPQQTATMYKLTADDLNLLVLGHIYPELSDAQLEQIGMIDVLVTPVGGNGYTLDPAGALGLIKKIEPKLVIPTHFDDKSLQFPVPQQTLDQALKGLVMEPSQTAPKLKVKPSDLTDTLQLIVLERS